MGKVLAYCENCNDLMGVKSLIGKRKTCSPNCRKAKSRKLKGIKMKKRIYIDLHIASVGFRQHSMERDDKGVFVSCDDNVKYEGVNTPSITGEAIDDESIMINETGQVCKVIRQYDEWPNG